MASAPAGGRFASLFATMLARRPLAVALVLGFTVVMAAFAARVHPDFSVEMAFPTFDKSRVDYERFKRDFPSEDARAIVAVEAADLFEPAGLGRLRALENDLGRIANVIDTRGLATVKDIVADGEGIKMDRLFPPALSPAELAHGRAVATSDPLYRWNLAVPDGHATLIEVTLTKEAATRDAGRAAFLRAAREVIARHAAAAERAHVAQKLTLSGLPVVRAEFIELINADLNKLFPIAFVVVVLLLWLTFRNGSDVLASVVTILFSVVWTMGAMGIAGVPLHLLTQITPIVVMIVSISDTVHVITHYKEHIRGGGAPRDGIVLACVHSAFPCLLTEITIACGFVGLVANDIAIIQHFGIVTAAGMMLTWLANFTVLPLVLSFLKPKATSARAVANERLSAAARLFQRFSQFIERMVTSRPRRVLVVAAGIVLVSVGFGLRAGKEFYVYDDLRPRSALAERLRYIESVHGGTVPMAVYVEPGDAKTRRPDAMLDPAAVALIDRISARLEADFPREVKNASSIAKYLRKAHRLLAGEAIAKATPLPQTRALVAQELIAVDDPRALRDVLSFDRGTAAVAAMVPDEGSSHATLLIRRLKQYLADEERATGYHITLTGVFAISDGVYQSLVGGLLGSLAVAVLMSFVIFCVVLRSWRLAAIALIPNLLPLLFTLGFMSALHIDIKPSTVIIFSITLVIADDDTIQYMARLRDSYVALHRGGDAEPHRNAALGTLRDMGLPMFVTACAVSVGFLALVFSEFLALANLGLLIGVSLLSAVFADLFLSPILIMAIKPKIKT